MIDTVIIEVPKNKMSTSDVQSWRLESTGKGWRKLVKNTTTAEKEGGLASIKLTWYKRADKTGSPIEGVRIEFSVAKLINGNNLTELEDKDFLIAIKILRERLLKMGEDVSEQDIENASVYSFHPAKNFVLTDGYTASSVIRDLAKINVNKKFDLTSVTFANDGSSLQIRTKSHSITFYDKIADGKKDEKRAIDKDQSPQQRSLFDEIKKDQPALEILRLEVRLSEKRKMREVMKKLGFASSPTFKDVFQRDVCQKIVGWYWEEIIKGENLFLFELINSPKRLLRKIVRNHKIKAKHAVFLVGLSVLCKDDGGIRELRELLKQTTKQRNWYTLTKSIELLNGITNKKSLHSWVQQIDDGISRFEALKLSTGDVNNSKVS